MINEMGETLAKRAAARATSSWCSPTSARPNNARSAMTSPNAGPHMGFIRLALVDPEQRKLSQREIADQIARDPRRATIPGVEFLQWPGGLVASVFSNGYIAPLVVEVRGDNLERARRAGAAPSPRSRAPSPASATSTRRSQIDYPEVRVDTDREKAGLVGVTRARRGADDARGDARQHQHAERLDRRRQRPVVLRRHLLRRARPSPIPNALAAAPGARRRRRQAGHARRLRHDPPLGWARSPSSATSCSAPRTCCMQTEGRDIGSAAARARAGAAQRSAHRATSSSTSSARSS